MNDPDSGILDNDRNGDGIPDFIFPISEINLKVKMFETVDSMQEYIKANDSMCFGISIDHNPQKSIYHAYFHFDDTASPLGRT